MTDHHTEVSPTDVAIIGIACNFAGAPGPEAFWERIREGRELLTHFTEDDLRAAGIPEQLLANPDYIRVSSLVDGAGDFDADFFGITPSESRLMDPQHRLMLELGWHAMEDAGYDPSRYPGDVGVFVGGGRHAYLRYIEPQFDPEDHLDGSIRGLQADIGNYGDFLATRISYRLGLTGPSLNVQTACSTALVAVHLACQSLFLGESDIALAGGVNLHTPQVNGYLYEEGSICSPDGRLRPFDADANGSVFGNGGGLVVLKRLSDAIAEGDRVIAVIKGSAINNDGSEKMTFTGPSVDGQAEVISRALRTADVDPATVGFVETHGTGTALGDPIEVAALVSAFGPAADDTAGCALGAVKAQIGHLGTSAGVAGIIKAALVLERAEIPPMVNFNSLNPGIELTGSPFYIPTESRPFEGLRRAGVSAFGVGGTNAHAVLEQAPAVLPVPRDSGDEQKARALPFVLSARSADALAALRTAHGLALRSRPGLRAADAAHVLARGRKRFRHRTFVAAATPEEAAAQLTSGATTISGVAPEAELPVVFAFAGEGGQYAGLGRALYEGDAAYRRTVDELSELALDIAGFDVRTLLYPEPGDEEAAADRLSRALWAQPAMFVSQYALATSLIAAGVVPHTMVGHSLGEYAVACVAGVLSTSDALRLVSARGRLMQEETPDGAMLAVGMDEDELRAILPADLDIACVNAVGQCVVSGATETIDAFQAHLEETDLRHTPLGTSNAAHSRLMVGIVAEYRALLAQVRFGKASMRIVSTVTGRELGPDEMADPEYWVRHMLQPVRFRDAARTVLEDGPVTVVEAGPSRALTRMFENSGGAAESRPVTPWMRNEWAPKTTAELLGAVWVQGGRIDWDRQFAGLEPHQVSLPGYPFERSEHWIDVTRDHSPVELPDLRRSSRLTGWLQVPRWTVASPPEAAPAPAGPRRVLLPRPAVSAAADALAAALEAAGHHVVPLLPGDRPELDPAGSRLVVRPGDHDDLRMLHELLAAGESGIDTVLFAGLPDRGAGEGPLAGRVTDALEQGFWPLVTAVRGVAAHRGERGLDVLVVTTDRHQVAAGDPIDPVMALLTGPCRVLPQEYPTVRLAELDLSAGLEPKAAAALVLAELGRPVTARTVAHRAGIRRLLAHEPLPALTAGRPWRDGGSYLITGGLGAIGLALAEDAAESDGVTLVLTHRSAWPAEDTWERVAEDPATSPEWRERAAALLRLRRAGAAVHCVRADAADREAMREVRERYGPFHGVVHAAGVPSGRLAAVLDDEHVRQVMSPKVDGALVLDEVVADATTAWTAYCSSMSAVVGGLGHTDYCSANAFLDAFAQWRTAAGRRTVSLGFDAWTEGGMAVKEATRSRTTAATEADGEDWRPFEHPVFSARAEGQGYGVFRGELRQGTDWILDEHRVAGRSLVPGTAVVEFVRSAAEAHLGTTGFDITELDLLRPLSAPGPALAFTVRVDGSAGDDEMAVTVCGLGPDKQWYRQAVGRIEPGAPVAEPKERLEIPAGSGEPGSLPGSDLITFGPRWDNIERIWRSGADELLLDCRLPSRFTDDLGRYGVHPALLDTAAGALVSGVSDRVHLPMSYERITVHAPMPARIVSRITHRESGESGSLRFDVRIENGSGQPVLDILGYSLREVDPDRVAADLGAGADAEPAAAANRSLVSTEAGDLGALRMVPAERHEPAAGEIEVEVRATGLNFKEVLIAAGALEAPGPDHRFGLECAGVVTAVGEGVIRFRVGDAVMAIGASCFSDYVVVRDALACRIPAGMTFGQAASIPVAFTTAYDCLVNVGALARGERVLVHAAAGGVGLAAMQIAAHRGAEVFATAGNETKRNVVKGLGATLVMDSRSLDFEAETLAAGGIDVVLNSLAGEFIPAGMRTLRPRGRFVEIGRRDILAHTSLDLGLFASGRTFSAYNPEIDGDAWERAWRSVTELLRQGVITPLPVRTFGVDEADDAFSFMSRAHHIGKVVVIRAGGNEPVSGRGSDAGEAAGAEGITARRGVLAFRDALGAGPAHMLVSRRVPAATGDQFVVAGHVLQGGGTGSCVHSRPELPYPLIPLEGDTEERLGSLWGGLLSIEQIGRDDHFLDLGGDSLYATQLVARIRNAFGVRVAPADILGGLSVRELAELIDRRLTAAAEAGE